MHLFFSTDFLAKTRLLILENDGGRMKWRMKIWRLFADWLYPIPEVM